MRYRDLDYLVTQGDREYAEARWSQFSAVIGVGGERASGIGLEYHLHRPVRDEDTPSSADIACWVAYALKPIGDDKRVLIHCAAGQNRSLIIGTLIQSLFEKRLYADTVREIHERCLQENPPHDWWPYAHWLEAINKWQEVQVEQKLPELRSFAANPGAIPLEEALSLAGEQRPDYLTCLYHYASQLQTPARVLEIGTYKGDSLLMLASALKGSDSQIISVDPIFQSGGVFVPDAHLKFPGYYESSLVTILNRLSSAGLGGYCSFIPDYSKNALQGWDGRLIDWIHLDGEHTKAAIMQDLEWSKFLKPKGIISIDDWFAEIEEGTHEWLAAHPGFTILHESTDAPDGNMVITLLKKDT